ncbi:hypothetical protein TeGR_g3981, partial [Tetraparma gracilis]
NVASFLALDLNLDWRLGAGWFEEQLIDHDVHSNYVSWAMAAGVTGGRLNKFNVVKQARDYDADGLWDFRDCSDGQPVLDSIGETLRATPSAGATCSPSGVSLGGGGDMVALDALSWEAGSPVSVELRVRLTAFPLRGRVVEFGATTSTADDTGAGASLLVYGNPYWSGDEVGDEDASSSAIGVVASDPASREAHAAFTSAAHFEQHTWVHLVVARGADDLKVFKNGVQVGSYAQADGTPGAVATYVLGNRGAGDRGMEGTMAYVQYFKIWHGVKLTQSDVTALYAPLSAPHHSFDFRSCDGSTVSDASGGLTATLDGVACGEEGAVFDSAADFIQVTPAWEWGGPATIEVLVKMGDNPSSTYGRLFDFGEAGVDPSESGDNVFVFDDNGSGRIGVFLYVDGTLYVDGGTATIFGQDFHTSEWTHLLM